MVSIEESVNYCYRNKKKSAKYFVVSSILSIFAAIKMKK